MPTDAHSWIDWGTRLRAHMKEKRLRAVVVADALKMSESALRSWINGNRELNLHDFFRLCAAVKADPSQILFGRPSFSPEQRKQIGEMVATMLEQDPATNPQYTPMIGRLQKDLNHKRGKK